MNVDRFWYANQTAMVPAVWHYASGIVSLLCLIIGIVCNGLVILVFIKNEVLQRPRNYFLINLAITDLGLLLTNNSLHVISSFKTQWIFGQKGCNFYSVCGGIFGLTSIATMALISLNRLSAVNDPFSSLKLSARSTLRYLVCAWIYGSIWILPPLFGWNRFILEGFGTSCTFDYVSKDLYDRLFILILVTGGFLIPLSIIVLSYSSILMKLSQRSCALILQNENGKKDPTIYNFNDLNPTNEIEHCRVTPLVFDSNDENHIIQQMRRTEIRATRTVLLICTVFCLAWGPYALMALISLFGFNHLINAYTTSLLGMLTKVAACINPIIYAISLNGFREQIASHIKCIHPNVQEQRQASKVSSTYLIHKNLSNLPNSSSRQQTQSAIMVRDSI
ncbi:unnamed protein product [Adineta steineri]|uniref:G-protein coupled receptors family 1 profile domain-containing protein n=1 Tax=Adineta steineri TaxID=433720 RepID=A0A815E9G4_9BILA|nr:unnamed protein product [Adineta steineri]CAF3710175.1 unnamed protein product [Adineta steineri]